ncbi:alpha-tubulin N-acetyltransferase 1 isoform X6 [Brachyhypopomus gauderio]|uniref:alpha-tubulin N-acetyltransferase 1 isoform X6 n=1 Tax=Brachyhypopomus gauderio TaxID=698409 RepID=UPI004042C173
MIDLPPSSWPSWKSTLTLNTACLSGPTEKSPAKKNRGRDQTVFTDGEGGNQGLVARSNLYSRHITSRGLGLLLEEQLSALKLPGLQPVVSVKGCDTGGKADALRHTNTSESTPVSQNQAVSIPPLPGSRSSRCPHAPTAGPRPTEEAVVNDRGGVPSPRPRGGERGVLARGGRPVLDGGREALHGPVGPTETRTSQHTPLVTRDTDPGERTEGRRDTREKNKNKAGMGKKRRGRAPRSLCHGKR